MSQEMEYPTLLCHHPDEFANIKCPTLLSSHLDGETGATMTKVGDTGATVESTWGNQILGVATTTAGTSKTMDAVDASSVRLPIVHPNDVNRVLRMNDMVHAVRKAWAPKGHHRHVNLQIHKPICLEEVCPTTSFKHELATTTCCSLSGMKKLFSVFMLRWGHHGADASLELEDIRTDLRRGHFPFHVQHDEPESRNEDSVTTGKPWYRESYSRFPKRKYAANKCTMQSLITCHVTEQHQKSVPGSKHVTGIKLPIERRHSDHQSLISWE